MTSRDTAQTLWLYRAAELALEQGAAGFEIVASVEEDSSGELRLSGRGEGLVVERGKPTFVAEIRLLASPVSSAPPRVFEARSLKAALEPYVGGEHRCDGGNVCPHIKDYLRAQ